MEDCDLSLKMQTIERIAIIGNGGGGKSTLARRLGEIHDVPVIHVDSIQYLAGMKVREVSETSKLLIDHADEKTWVIDGFGTFEVMEKRFQLADIVIFIDFPLWRHYYWCLKRQISSLWAPRKELPDDCKEATISHTMRLFKILWRVHRQIRPRLLKLFLTNEFTEKVVIIRDVSAWKRVYDSGLIGTLDS